MSENQRALAKDEPLMVAWEAYKATPAFANTLTWAQHCAIQPRQDGTLAITHPSTEGSLWGAFMAGWKSGAQAICEHSDIKAFSNGVLACKTCGKEAPL
jgi:hypothetical protein